jgi:hypothetical protein
MRQMTKMNARNASVNGKRKMHLRVCMVTKYFDKANIEFLQHIQYIYKSEKEGIPS